MLRSQNTTKLQIRQLVGQANQQLPQGCISLGQQRSPSLLPHSFKLSRQKNTKKHDSSSVLYSSHDGYITSSVSTADTFKMFTVAKNNIIRNVNLIFRGPCIVIYSYNKGQKDALFHKFILVKNSTCFGQIYCPSSGVSTLYTQQ